MIDLVTMMAVFLVGFLLGLFFFGGLLWTVRRGLSSKHPALWFLGSWLVRVGVVVGGFYLLFNGRWQRLVVAVAAFLIARTLIIRFAPSTPQSQVATAEAGDAS